MFSILVLDFICRFKLFYHNMCFHCIAGPDDSRDPQKGGIQNALVVGPTMQQKGINNVGPQGKSTALISGSKSSERFSTSAIMERIPSKWPRPVWHPPWKNYRLRA
eukprot:XP_025014628.1 protein pleiotropic regulator PRL2-like isoform X2 [Ricinus communis]